MNETLLSSGLRIQFQQPVRAGMSHRKMKVEMLKGLLSEPHIFLSTITSVKFMS